MVVCSFLGWPFPRCCTWQLRLARHSLKTPTPPSLVSQVRCRVVSEMHLPSSADVGGFRCSTAAVVCAFVPSLLDRTTVLPRLSPASAHTIISRALPASRLSLPPPPRDLSCILVTRCQSRSAQSVLDFQRRSVSCSASPRSAVFAVRWRTRPGLALPRASALLCILSADDDQETENTRDIPTAPFLHVQEGPDCQDRIASLQTFGTSPSARGLCDCPAPPLLYTLTSSAFPFPIQAS